MKTRNILAAGLLAAAGAALLAPSASAQVVTYTTGDLLLGFEQPGSTNDYVIDLGPASTFINATPNSSFNVTVTLNLGNISADLSTAFGSSWASNSQTNLVEWGIAGGTSRSTTTFGLPKDTLFFTEAETTPGVPTNTTKPLQRAVAGSQSTVDGNIQTFGANFNGETQTANSTVATIQTTSLPSNWSSYNPSLQAFGSSDAIEQTVGGAFGPTNSDLDLYELQPGSGGGTYLGNFTLSSGGALEFQAATSVPEPSNWGMMSLGAGLLGMFRFRRPEARA